MQRSDWTKVQLHHFHKFSLVWSDHVVLLWQLSRRKSRNGWKITFLIWQKPPWHSIVNHDCTIGRLIQANTWVGENSPEKEGFTRDRFHRFLPHTPTLSTLNFLIGNFYNKLTEFLCSEAKCCRLQGYIERNPRRIEVLAWTTGSEGKIHLTCSVLGASLYHNRRWVVPFTRSSVTMSTQLKRAVFYASNSIITTLTVQLQRAPASQRVGFFFSLVLNWSLVYFFHILDLSWMTCGINLN